MANSPKVRKSTDFEFSKPEVQLLIELLEMETTYQLTQIYLTAKPENVKDDMTSVFSVFRGYRTVDDHFNALNLLFKDLAVGTIIKVKMEERVANLALNLLNFTAVEMDMDEFVKKLYVAHGTYLLEKLAQAKKELDQIEDKPTVAYNIFTNQASA